MNITTISPIKFKSLLFIILLFILFIPNSLFSQSVFGNVNHDGTVNILDALLTAQYYVALPVQVFYTEEADVNGDGRINILDALLISQYYVRLITEFPTPYPEDGIFLNANQLAICRSNIGTLRLLATEGWSYDYQIPENMTYESNGTIYIENEINNISLPVYISI